MKRASLAAGLLIGAASTLTFAQTPAATEVPKFNCDPKPTLPGARLMEEPSVRKRFQSEVDAYKKCMTTYLDDRKASINAHTQAANAAVEEYNKTMKELQDQQKAQQ